MEEARIEASNNPNTPPKAQTGPWLVFMSRRNKITDDDYQTFYSIPEKKSYRRKMDDVKGYKLWFTSQDNWMLTQESNSSKYCLWNPLTSQKVFLPSYKMIFRPRDRCAITSSPLNPNCKLICVFRNCLSLFDFETNEWSRHYIVEGDKLIVPPLLALNGNIYCRTVHNMLAVIDLSDHSKVRILEEMPGSDWYPVGSSYEYREYFLESCGDMFFVKTYSRFIENSNIAHLVVYKRDGCSEEWNAVDDIGDRVFFLGRRDFTASWSASELNVKGNCIYYLLENKSCLYMFNLSQGTIRVDAPCREALCKEKSTALFWIMPSL